MGIRKTDLALCVGRHGTALEFVPGETVKGAVVLTISGSKPHKLSGVVVKVRGKAETDWKSGMSDNETRHHEKQMLLELDLHVLGPDAAGRPAELRPGTHQLPFSFQLPARIAYTLKHMDGEVAYECSARAHSDSFWAFDGRARTKFTVLPRRSLINEYMQLQRPLTVQREARFSLLGRDPGAFTVRLTQQGFTPGEVMELWVEGSDRARQQLAAADTAVQLKARLVFRAGSSSREKKWVVAEVRPGSSAEAWRCIRLPVPPGEVTLDDTFGCTIISVSHYVKVRDVHVPVVLGTEPFLQCLCGGH